MSAITIENDLVHYEVLGRGRPVILLHGWLGSWRYWVPAMRQLSMQYRVYALDLWGFGDTAHEAKFYGFPAQVKLLDQFMTKMGIEKAALVGHDLGAAVIARFAANEPTRVPRLLMVCPPLFRFAPNAGSPAGGALPAGSKPALPSGQDASGDEKDTPGEDGEIAEAPTMMQPPTGWAERLKKAQADAAAGPKPAREAAIPPTDQPAKEIEAAGTGPPAAPGGAVSGEVQVANPLREHLGVFDAKTLLERSVEAGSNLEKLKAEANKAADDVIEVSVNSFTDPQADTFRTLKNLTVPAVLVYGTEDKFLPPPEPPMLQELSQSADKFHAIAMPGIKHFPMLEAIDAFSRLLLDFLETSDVQKLAIKQTWERRVR